MGILEFLTNFDFTTAPRAMFGSYRDGRKHGDGVIESTIGTVTGHNAAAFFAPLYGKHDGAAIKKILRREGIDMWGWNTYGDQQFFHVHRNETRRAMAALKRAGVELDEPW